MGGSFSAGLNVSKITNEVTTKISNNSNSTAEVNCEVKTFISIGENYGCTIKITQNCNSTSKSSIMSSVDLAREITAAIKNEMKSQPLPFTVSGSIGISYSDFESRVSNFIENNCSSVSKTSASSDSNIYIGRCYGTKEPTPIIEINNTGSAYSDCAINSLVKEYYQSRAEFVNKQEAGFDLKEIIKWGGLAVVIFIVFNLIYKYMQTRSFFAFFDSLVKTDNTAAINYVLLSSPQFTSL